MKQRTTEWLEITKNGSAEYHEKQYREIKRSTIKFFDWLESKGIINPDSKLSIADMASGMGANLRYMAERYLKSYFLGIDINSELINWGQKFHKDIANTKLIIGDWYNFPTEEHKREFDGIVSFQTLSWLQDFREPINKLIELEPKWIGLTSLFFEGDINCTIAAQDYTEPIGGKDYKETYYNIYSLPLVEKFGYIRVSQKVIPKAYPGI
jgi:hypothetical protein